MGRLFYGSDDPIEIDDGALAHLRVVIVAKLRRRETFTISWKHSPREPRGRSTLWVHPSIPVRFEFDAHELPELDPGWLEALAASANLSGGIHLVPEDGGGPLTLPAYPA